MYSWVSTEFRWHEIPSTRNSPVDTEFRIQKCTEFREIPGSFADFRSQSLRYCMNEFEYFKWKYVRIKSKIIGLAEVESASFFLVR
jgi:hypothetical protein